MEVLKDNISSSSFPQKLSLSQENLLKKDIYDDELITLINGLNESIKEYYKVSRLISNETNNYISAYEKEKQSIEVLIRDVINNKQYQKLNELYNILNIINEIFNKLHININSCDNNLSLFFEDCKILFKKMKMNRKQKISEIIINNNHMFKDAIIANENNIKNKALSPLNKNNSFALSNSLQDINKIYIRIITLLNKFGDFNLLINQANPGKSNEYNNLQNNIKNELNLLMKTIKINLSNNMNNVNTNIYSNNNFNITNNEKNGKRSYSQSRGVSEKMQRLEKMKLIYEKKIKNLTNQLNLYRKNNIQITARGGAETDINNSAADINNNNNNLKLKIKKLEQIIKEKDNIIMSLNNNIESDVLNNNSNFNKNMNDIIKIKDSQILNLQEELNVYQKNEGIFNSEIIDLNNKIQSKINQNQKQISLLNKKNVTLSQALTSKIKEIEKLQNEIKNLNMTLRNNGITNIKTQKFDEQSINEYNRVIEELKNTINQLNKEILIYKKKEKSNEEMNNKYIERIEELNNNILSNNKILEQKDEIIKQLNEKICTPDCNNKLNTNANINNEIKILKLENENLKKQIEFSKKINKNPNMNSNNNNSFKDITPNENEIKELKALNVQLMEENNELRVENEEIAEKIKKLTLDNQQMQESFSSQKEIISKLENDINKKNEELEGFKAVIFKLQTKLENKDDNLGAEHAGSFSNSQQNAKNIKASKSMGDINDKKTKNLISQLNEAEKTITALQKQVKELQFKLDEKQVEKELSGYRTEDNNYSNFEEEFDLRKMINGTREKNRSEDINIDYPGIVGIKDRNRELMQKMKMLEEQVKILICNISCTNKTKPQITQICQLMRIPAKNISLIIAGKDKKRALGIID